MVLGDGVGWCRVRPLTITVLVVASELADEEGSQSPCVGLRVVVEQNTHDRVSEYLRGATTAHQKQGNSDAVRPCTSHMQRAH